MSNKILVPGSVLLDIYQDTGESFLGGACFNFSCHIHNLTGQVDFISRIGKDKAGQTIMKELHARRFPTGLIQLDHRKPTKTVQVHKDKNNQPYYIIATDVATEYLDYPLLSDRQIAAYELIYFGTTIQSSVKSRSTLRNLLKRNRAIKFCDINLRPDKYTEQTVDYALKTCNVLKINEEELSVIAGQYKLTGKPAVLIEQMSSLFNIPVICLTLGPQGSMLYDQLTGLLIKEITPVDAVDTVGAGDAFSAVLAIGLLKKWTKDKILDTASQFAEAICRIKGAVPQANDFYTPWRTLTEA